MLSTIGQEAWVHVLDRASDFPEVLGHHTSEWLHLLPEHERSLLAVVSQNEHHARITWDTQAQKHGAVSQQAIDAAHHLQHLEQTTAAVIDQVVAMVQSLLAGCVSDSKE
jgi:hypothetical protein